MRKKRYTNADLDAAENGFVAAGAPELIQPMRQMTQGWRNMFQGEWGQSFVNALESMNERQTKALADVVRGEVGALHQEVSTRLGKLEQDTELLKRGQERISGEVQELRERLDRKRKELDDIHAWQERMDARAAAYPEEEIAELVDYVRRKKAEDEAGDVQPER